MSFSSTTSTFFSGTRIVPGWDPRRIVVSCEFLIVLFAYGRHLWASKSLWHYKVRTMAFSFTWMSTSDVGLIFCHTNNIISFNILFWASNNQVTYHSFCAILVTWVSSSEKITKQTNHHNFFFLCTFIFTYHDARWGKMYQVTYGRYNLEELSAIPINPMLQDKISYHFCWKYT